jgi:hypothetical protein
MVEKAVPAWLRCKAHLARWHSPPPPRPPSLMPGPLPDRPPASGEEGIQRLKGQAVHSARGVARASGLRQQVDLALEGWGGGGGVCVCVCVGGGGCGGGLRTWGGRGNHSATAALRPADWKLGGPSRVGGPQDEGEQGASLGAAAAIRQAGAARARLPRLQAHACGGGQQGEVGPPAQRHQLRQVAQQPRFRLDLLAERVGDALHRKVGARPRHVRLRGRARAPRRRGEGAQGCQQRLQGGCGGGGACMCVCVCVSGGGGGKRASTQARLPRLPTHPTQPPTAGHRSLNPLSRRQPPLTPHLPVAVVGHEGGRQGHGILATRRRQRIQAAAVGAQHHLGAEQKGGGGGVQKQGVV